MKRSVKRAAPVAAVCLTFVCALGAACFGGESVSASANSAPAYWRGTEGMGVLPTEGNCPVEAERETLTLEINTLPQNAYASQEEFASYDARVTAEYTFCNPTDEDLTVGLAFPFGTIPEYLADGPGAGVPDDSSRYAVTVDGEAAETQLRYTYCAGYGGLIFPAAERAAGKVLQADADLYAFSYTADAGTVGKRGDRFLEVCLSYSPARTRILRENCWDYRVENGNLVLFLYLDAEEPARFFAAGEKPQIEYVKVVEGERLYGDSRTYVEDARIAASERRTTFGAWVEESRIGGVGETDWYNAVFAYLEEVENADLGLVHGVPAFFSERWLMRWFCYSAAIPAGGSVVNTVTAPLYPDISGGVYRYRYLLSPAQGWARFGTLRVEIRTPYSVYGCSLALEEGAEGEYFHTREGLPLGELEFEIRSGRGEIGGGISAGGLSLLFLVVLPAAEMLIIGITLAIFFGVRAHRKKRARREGETR